MIETVLIKTVQIGENYYSGSLNLALNKILTHPCIYL